MKKLIVVLFILLSCIPLFARSQFGLSFSFENFWYTEPVDDLQIRSFIIGLEGANDFRDPGGLGIEYGIGLRNTINMKQGSFSNSNHGFNPELLVNFGLGYWHQFNNVFNFQSALGIRGTITTENSYVLDSFGISAIEAFGLNLAVYLKLAAEATLDHLKISIGCSGGIPVLNFMQSTSSNSTTSHHVDIKGIYVSPFISASIVL